MKSMEVKIETSWNKVLQSEFEQPYFVELMNFVDQAYQSQTVYPPKELIFSAFDFVPFEDVKVVILGQDPYHGFGQANGLCFSVYDGVPFPPSLKNIFKEIESDLAEAYPISGNLERWAEQGVLLLNAVLTVEQGKADSHKSKGWEKFTDAIIREISAQNEGVVFMLWGGKAHKKGAKIDENIHLVLRSGHPSPLSANKGHWFGNQHFSKANSYLVAKGKQPINW